MFYDFKCQNCGFLFEKEKSMRDETAETCPKCGKNTEKVITGGAGILSKSSSDGYRCSPEICGKDPSICGMDGSCGLH